MKTLQGSALVCFMLLKLNIALFAQESAKVDPADLVLLGGSVVTVDDQQPVAQAVAVREDRIIAVGKDEQVSAMIGPETQVVKLQGRFGDSRLYRRARPLCGTRPRENDLGSDESEDLGRCNSHGCQRCGASATGQLDCWSRMAPGKMDASSDAKR